MIFGGFQKLTLLDYPGKVACTLFTKGCNFYCPFCHNAYLVDLNGNEENITEDEVLTYLSKRTGILEGICITGGEPLLHKDIECFIKKVKEFGFSVKLDTNGSFPEKLKSLIQNGLVDYVAMDIKNSFEKYSLTAGCETLNINDIKTSINYLINSKIDYEFRTTVVNELHDVSDIEKISLEIAGAKNYFLQNFVDSGNVISDNLSPVPKDKIFAMKAVADKNVTICQVRGMA